MNTEQLNIIREDMELHRGVRKPTSKLVIAVDFDGTCVTHNFPDIGDEIGAAPVLSDLVEVGAKLILWTVRDGAHLAQAVDWFSKHRIPLWGVQNNPTQRQWSESRKVHADVFIDDLAFGAPLVHVEDERPHIDWSVVREHFFGGGGYPC